MQRILSYLKNVILCLVVMGPLIHANSCKILVAKDLDISSISPIEESAITISSRNSDKLSKRDQLFQALQEYDLVLTAKRGQIYTLNITLVSPSRTTNWVPIVLERKIDEITCENLSRLKDIIKKDRENVLSLINYTLDRPEENTLGDIILEREASFLEGFQQEIIDLEGSKEKYRHILGQIKGKVHKDTFFRDWLQVTETLYSNEKENIDYCKDNTLLSDALLKNCTNCQGETLLILALFKDAEFNLPKDWILSFEVFKDHIRPIAYNAKEKRVFDLTYNQFGPPRAAIYPFTNFPLTLLKGLESVTHPLEEKLFEDSLTGPISKPKLCINMQSYPHHRRELILFNDLHACGNFSDSPLPEGIVDASRRASNSISFYEERPSLVDGAFGTLSNLFNGAEESRSFAYQEDYLKELFSKGLTKVNEEDEANIRLWNSDEINTDEFIERYSVNTILNGLGIPSIELFPPSSILKYCALPRPIISLPKSALDKNQQNDNYRGFILIEEGLVPNFENLSLKDRYIQAIRVYENRILELLPIIENAFNISDLKNSLIQQDVEKEKLDTLYGYLLTHKAMWDKLYDCDLHTNSNTIPSTKVPLFKEKIAIVEKYFNFLENNPAQLLIAIKEAHDQHNANKFNIFNHWSALYFVIDSYSIERRFFYKARTAFTNYLLLNDDYYFAPPETNDNDNFGSVRPLSPLQFEEFKKLEKKTSQSEINLPQLNHRCGPQDRGLSLGRIYDKEGDFQGYSGFYIDCGNGAENHEGEDPIHKEGSSSQTTAGLDQSPQDENNLPDNQNSNLKPDERVDREIINGDPNAQNSDVAPWMDPRQEVTIDVKYWNTLAYALSSSIDKGLYGALIHNLQTESIKNIFHQAFSNKMILETSYMKEGTLRLSSEVYNLIALNSGKDRTERIGSISNLLSENIRLEWENEVPVPFAKKPFLVSIYKKYKEFGLKEGWSETTDTLPTIISGELLLEQNTNNNDLESIIMKNFFLD